MAIAAPTAAFGETCEISAFPSGPVQPGATVDVNADCTGSPTLIQWSSSLADCAPLTGPSTVCNFPTVGTAVLTVAASYEGSFGGSFGGSFAAFDSYAMQVSTSVPSCQISASPPGPVQPGAYADLFAECTGSPMIQWSSSLAYCYPATGPSTSCYFPTVGTAVLTAEAAYSGSFGAGFSVFESYPMEVSSVAPPSCHIIAYPPGPVQPGAFVDAYANCSDGPTLIQWSSSLADCVPSTGWSTVCHFPTVGNAVLAVQASYAGSFGGSFGGSFAAFDSYAMEVSTVAPPSCRISAVPPGPVQAGDSASLNAGCTGSPALIQWSSSLADCAPLTGPTTVCSFPTAGWANLWVEASYAGSLGGGFPASDYYSIYVNPTTFTVTTTDDDGPGSLRWIVGQAIAAGNASTVDFAPDVTGTITLTGGEIRIWGPVSIVGPGANNLAIDADANGRIFSIYSTDPACPALDGPDYLVSISRLRLTNARRTSSNSAGAIFTEHSLALDAVIVDNNTAGNGGGVTFQIQYPGQSFTINESQFLDNIAQPLTADPSINVGGAVALYEKCTGTRTSPVAVTIANSLFSGNRAQPVGLSAFGGAINAYSHADITITDTRIVDNHVDVPIPPVAGRRYSGGGIYAKAKSLTIVRSEISGNSADVGGGLALESVDLDLQTPATAMATTIVNSTISGNVAGATAGAAFVYGNIAVELDNSTVSDNTAAVTRTGGILFNTGATIPSSASPALAGTLRLVSSILANSQTAVNDLSAAVAGGIPSFTVDATHSLIETICASPTCEITVVGTNNLIAVDPLLGSLAFNGGSSRTNASLAGSPVLDAGSNPLGLSTDQRGVGFARVSGAAADMGAYESPVTLDVDASITATRYDALTDGVLVIRYLLGLTGVPLTNGVVGGTATRIDPAAITTYLDAIRPRLDVDDNGSADASTDGVLILRYLIGLRGDALIAGAVGLLAERKTAADIEAYIQTLMP